MAMHIGMADMSIFRYAKKASYGFTSAAGMFLGHFLAWLAASILYAVVLVRIVPEGMQLAEFLPTITNEQMPSVAPGPLAYNATGIAGAICVIIAGWTTANPTIYRAGLAIQGMFPSSKRWKVTLVVGLITTIAACFPALVMRLLEFVALYGLLLMPMGAIIFIDFYILPRLGLKQDYAFERNIRFSWAAAITWIATLALCLILNFNFGIEIFFLGLPGWFLAALLYVVTSKLYQKKTVFSEAKL
jgi:purine-cytosine permease-like protein